MHIESMVDYLFILALQVNICCLRDAKYLSLEGWAEMDGSQNAIRPQRPTSILTLPARTQKH